MLQELIQIWVNFHFVAARIITGGTKCISESMTAASGIEDV